MAEKEVVKLVDLQVGDMANMMSTLAGNIVAQVTQQVSQQVSEQVSKAVGQLQSDLASRTIVKADTDIGQDERIRSGGARDDAAWGYKTNVSDFLIGTNNIANQGTLQNQLTRMIEGSINHYNTVLADERVSKGHSQYYTLGKIQQEQRHADIASENQWEDGKEIAGEALAAELVKSVQVPPAATEYE